MPLEKMIEQKVEHGDKVKPAAKAKHRPSNVIDLVKVLEESLGRTRHGKKEACQDC